MNRRIIVHYDLGGSVQTDIFSAQYSVEGDIAVTATPHGPVTVKMRDGKNAFGNKVSGKVYLKAYSAEVQET